MKHDYAKAFVHATTDVFSTMLCTPVRRSGVALTSGMHPAHDVAGVVGLTGKKKSTVALSMPRETAIKAAECLLQESVGEFNQDVIDAVGELANMIAGAAKAQLEGYKLSLGLPKVIVDKSAQLDFPSDSTPYSMAFDSGIGPVAVEIGVPD